MSSCLQYSRGEIRKRLDEKRKTHEDIQKIALNGAKDDLWEILG